MKFSREWAMPSRHTFSIPPIRKFIDRYLHEGDISVDPFAGESQLATFRNDLGQSGLTAAEWLDGLNVQADVVLLDPPYSPRQMAEVYRSVGRTGMEISQNARLYRDAKDRLTQLLKPGGYALTFGWNSVGFGKERGFEIMEILLVSHGAAHNDTICVAERRLRK